MKKGQNHFIGAIIGGGVALGSTIAKASANKKQSEQFEKDKAKAIASEELALRNSEKDFIIGDLFNSQKSLQESEKKRLIYISVFSIACIISIIILIKTFK